MLFDGKLCLEFSTGHCVIYKIWNIRSNSKKLLAVQPINSLQKDQPYKFHRDDVIVRQEPKNRRLTVASLEKELKLELEDQKHKTTLLIEEEQAQNDQIQIPKIQTEEIKKTVH